MRVTGKNHPLKAGMYLLVVEEGLDYKVYSDPNDGYAMHLGMVIRVEEVYDTDDIKKTTYANPWAWCRIDRNRTFSAYIKDLLDYTEYGKIQEEKS